MAQLARTFTALWGRSWLTRVSVIYVVSRLVSLAIMLAFAAQQGPSSYGAATPDYVTFANFWDARWYAYLATDGYPSMLPVDAHGHTLQNGWAFLPLYPFLVGGLAALTHLGWPLTAVIVSLIAGWGFVVVLYRLLSERLDPSQSTWAVAFAAFAPAAPILGVGYAEALFVFLLALALWLLTRRNYGLLAIVLLALAFTRPGALAFALTVAVTWLVRWRTRREQSFPLGERIALAALAAWAGILGLIWPVIAALVTGYPDAYLRTELSWRAGYIGWTELVPGTAWFQSAHWWVGDPWTYVLPLSAIVAFVAIVTLPATRKLGVELVSWVASYVFYLFLVFFPQSSTVRILAPLFPLAGSLAQLRSNALRFGIILLGIAGQVWWVSVTWIVVGSDWTPP